MKKLRVKPQGFSGEITAFLSMIFILVLSLIGVMIQSASIHITKSMKRADMELAMESIFAEYHPELLKQYEIFAKEGSDVLGISQRLDFYGAENMNHSIEKMELLSDYSGASFFEQAIRFMGGSVEEGQVPEDSQIEEEAKSVWDNLDDLLNEEENSLTSEDNPIAIVDQIKRMGILSIVLEHPEEVSEAKVVEENLASHRELQKGKGYEKSFPQSGISKKILFSIYLNQHFYNYQKQSSEHTLMYEAEYLLSGKPTDRENLNAVANKLILIRMGINYAYLLVSQEKQAEAAAMALGLTALLASPEAAGIVKHALLMAWAYGESILDLRSLFAGRKVPTVKTDENWILQLENIPRLLEKEEWDHTLQNEQGVDYQGYLKLLFLAEQEEILSMRALDLIELNLGLRVDECVTGLQMKSVSRMQRNITDTFTTEFVYQ